MSRIEQIRRIESLDREFSGYAQRASRSSLGPMTVMRRHAGWLLPGTGVALGVIAARVCTRNRLARGIGAVMTLQRAPRLVFKWLRSM